MRSKSSFRFVAPVAVLWAFCVVASCGDSFSVAFDPRHTQGGQGGAAGDTSEPSPGGGGKRGGSGGDGGSVNAPALTLVDTELPVGAFNAAYEHLFEVENAEGDVTFALVSGELPRGLSLSEEGTLSGVPTEAGEFEFTLGASDEREGELEVRLTVEIRRKRWLGYVTSGEVDSGLFVVDVAQAELTSTRVSVASAYVTSAPSFSPRGDMLAFTGLEEGDSLSRLYLVDVSGARPEVGTPASEESMVSAFSWSPDGRYIAYDATSPTDVVVFLLDLTTPEPTPRRIGSGSGSRWLGNTLVFNAYDPVNGVSHLRYVSVDDGAVSVIRQIEEENSWVLVEDPKNLRAVIGRFGSGSRCSESDSSSLVDFERGTRTVGSSGPSRYSPDLRYVTTFSGSMFRLLPVENFASAPALATGRSSGCDGIWSPDSKWFVFENGDGQLEVLSSEGSANQVLAPKAFDWPSSVLISPAGNPFVGFSPNGRWFRLLGSSGAELSRVTSAGFGVPRRMGSSSRQSASSWISPNSNLYLTWEKGEDGTTALQLFDISGEEPDSGRELVSLPPGTGLGLEHGSEVDVIFPFPPRFSADSSTLAYRMQENSADPKDVYIVDLLDDEASARNVSRLKCGNASCSVTHFAFQP